MRLRASTITGLLLAALAAVSASAQVPADELPFLQAVITGPADVAVGRTIVLDGSSSRTFGQKVQYQWFIGDNRSPISRSVEAVYTPERPGAITFRLVISFAQDGRQMTSEALHTITVYNRKIVLITDSSVPADKIAVYQQAATDAGVFLRILQAPGAPTPAGAEDAMAALLAEKSTALGGANAIVLWAEGLSGLQALMRTVQGNAELLAGMRNQTIVLITEQGLSTIARTARGPFSVLRPQQILVTRKEALNLVLTAQSSDEFLQTIEQRDIDRVSVDASTAGLRPWNILTYLVNAMLARGVPSQTVILLLVLPVIATILSFFKQVIGITTFGLYTPSIIALSFLALGWPLGIFFLLCVVTVSYAVRALMGRWRLLYIPKVAIVLTAVSISLLILLGLSAILGRVVTRETIFILLVLSTLAESFLNLKTEQGWSSALWSIGETIIAAMICVFIVQWGQFQSWLLAYPELILLTVAINAFLGRWTGLRLVEYFRFREVFRHLQEE